MANEDLIGYKYLTAPGTPAEEEIEVVGPCNWSDSYVTVRFPTGHETIKPVVAVRQRKLAEEGSSPGPRGFEKVLPVCSGCSNPYCDTCG